MGTGGSVSRPVSVSRTTSGAVTAPAGPASASTTRAARGRTQERMPDARAMLLRSAVQRVYRLGVLVGDRPALELHSRGQLVAAGEPLLVEEREPFDLLDAGQRGVRAVDLLLHAREDAGVARVQAGRGLGVEHEQRDVVGP